jgi:hypothetical protein
VKDEHKFEGVVKHLGEPAPRAKPFVKKAKGVA